MGGGKLKAHFKKIKNVKSADTYYYIYASIGNWCVIKQKKQLTLYKTKKENTERESLSLSFSRLASPKTGGQRALAVAS